LAFRAGLLTGPVAELDHALTYAAACLHSARASGDGEDARCILAWIDHRLDERLAFQLWGPSDQIEQIDTGGLT
jgi:hypothetical protein